MGVNSGVTAMSMIRTATIGRRLTLLPRCSGTRSFVLWSNSPPEAWEAAGYETSPRNGAPKIPSPWNKWFPYEPVPFSPRMGPYKVKVKKDEIYHWCSCGESAHESQPFCDNVGCSGTNFEPMTYIAPYDDTVFFCGSKHSPSKPLFNGTCWQVWMDVNPFAAGLGGFTLSFFVGVFLTWMSHP